MLARLVCRRCLGGRLRGLQLCDVGPWGQEPRSASSGFRRGGETSGRTVLAFPWSGEQRLNDRQNVFGAEAEAVDGGATPLQPAALTIPGSVRGEREGRKGRLLCVHLSFVVRRCFGVLCRC